MHDSTSDCTARQGPAASAWAVRWLGALLPGARVIDFACGSGRNTRAALGQGAAVLAVDRDRPAVASLPPEVDAQVADLEAEPWPFSGHVFDAVICCNYLHRPRLDLLASLVAPGGLLIYETFAAGNAAFGKPSSAAFLLQPGELLALAARARLHVLGYEDGYVAEPRHAMVQRICAVRPPFDALRHRVDCGV